MSKKHKYIYIRIYDPKRGKIYTVLIVRRILPREGIEPMTPTSQAVAHTY